MTRAATTVLALACAVSVAAVPPATLRAQSDERHADQLLDVLETTLGWAPPDPAARTDVRVMTRSALAFVPLPLVRLTAGEDDRVVATVTEWGAPDMSRPEGHASFFKFPPITCSADGALCAGRPRVVRSPEAKALWFALFIARSCNDRPRKVLSDAEDLFVRGRVGGVTMQFSCHSPNPRGVSPGDRQAAAVLRMSHRLLGR